MATLEVSATPTKAYLPIMRLNSGESVRLAGGVKLIFDLFTDINRIVELLELFNESK